MPKMKPISGTKKRFKVTGSGNIARKRAFGNHILEFKSSKRKRRLSQTAIVNTADEQRIKRMMALR